jgi:hypothetical protein
MIEHKFEARTLGTKSFSPSLRLLLAMTGSVQRMLYTINKQQRKVLRYASMSFKIEWLSSRKGDGDDVFELQLPVVEVDGRKCCTSHGTHVRYAINSSRIRTSRTSKPFFGWEQPSTCQPKSVLWIPRNSNRYNLARASKSSLQRAIQCNKSIVAYDLSKTRHGRTAVSPL